MSRIVPAMKVSMDIRPCDARSLFTFHHLQLLPRSAAIFLPPELKSIGAEYHNFSGGINDISFLQMSANRLPGTVTDCQMKM